MQPKTKFDSRFGFMQQRKIPMLDQFYLICHPYIVDVVTDDHSRYRCITVLLEMSEES